MKFLLCFSFREENQSTAKPKRFSSEPSVSVELLSPSFNILDILAFQPEPKFLKYLFT